MSEPGACGPAPNRAADRLPAEPRCWAYLMSCADGSLYAGWTNDLARRMRAHRTGRGAKYTRAHGGERLAYAELFGDRGAAMRREAALKKLPKTEKERLAAQWAAESRAVIRMATPADAPAVAELYGGYVARGVESFQYDLPTAAEYRTLIAETLQKAPFLVAYDGAGRLCGYACAHPWHTRQAYSWDVELTIYLSPACVGQGLGRRLYTALIGLLRDQGYWNAFALIANPNPASDAFHRAMGFTRFALEPRTGYKFGEWLGLTYWILPLCQGSGEPAPVRYAPDPKTLARVLREANEPHKAD